MAVSAADFGYIRALLRHESANTLSEGKEYLVESRLAPLARDEGLASVGELVVRLRAGAPRLRRDVLEAMMTNETYFFRDVHPFEVLRGEILPAMLQTGCGRPLSIWSAATSTGQEAISLALLLREHFARVPATILATDLSTKALDRARTGRFSQIEVNRGLPASLLVKYFERSGREWRVNDEILVMIDFRQINLATPVSGVGPMDVILLRNMLIYLDDAGRGAVLTELARILRPGGYLFLGAAETTYGLSVSYERVQVGRSICFRRSPYPSARVAEDSVR
jgi:chemotaxis protein methyltransferase CheR